jgi:hypothetical protein
MLTVDGQVRTTRTVRTVNGIVESVDAASDIAGRGSPRWKGQCCDAA